MVLQQSFKLYKKSIHNNIRGEQLPAAEFVNLGKIKKDITSDIPERFGEASAVWTGAISLAERFKKGELHGSTVARALNPKTLNRYFVKSSPHVRARCIDGRVIDHYGEAEAPADRPLGPQFPGGTLQLPCAAVLLAGEVFQPMILQLVAM